MVIINTNHTSNQIMYPFWKMVPYNPPHGGIVIGKGGHYIQQLSQQMRCLITAKKPEPERKRFKHYFLIEGYNEHAIFMATIHIQGLLMESMMKMDQKQRNEISDTGHQNQHLNLVIADREEQIKKMEKKHVLESCESNYVDGESSDEEDIITISGLSI